MRTKNTLCVKDQERNPAPRHTRQTGEPLIEQVGNYLIAAATQLGNFVIVNNTGTGKPVTRLWLSFPV